ncbi:CubicO group peptidase (beta-lactamase class C family) [Rhodococcus sp. OAS809]|uniref:serine hydrolase domain-containing protein n=1 Tax=Rhodococcus sp. OAS809 TaxID=2663874 RepID=UPI001789E5DB
MTSYSAPLEADSATWATPPYHRHGLNRVDNLIPCAEIAKGDGDERSLQTVNDQDWWASLQVPSEEGALVGAAEFLDLTRTDSIIVLQGEKILHEEYRGASAANSRHIVMSISKSFCGMLAGILVSEGVLSVADVVSTIVPELKGTSFGSASVRHLLDMSAAPKYDMTYLDTRSEVNAADRAAGWRPRLVGDARGTREFLTNLEGNGRHGAQFQYCSGTTDVLAWVLERAAGEKYSQLLETRIWSRLGAEANAYITVDAHGDPYACAGMGMRLRDLARFGLLLLGGGRYADDTVVPLSWIDQTRGGGDFPNGNLGAPGTYRNQWWVPADRSSFYAVGIYGQYLWLDPKNNVVIAKFSSCDSPVDHRPDHEPALGAIAQAVAPVSGVKG